MDLVAIVYWLCVGISFDIACETLKRLKAKESEWFTSGQVKQLILLSPQDAPLSLI
ncbi:MerR family transcriptional regulator ['Nostoc azollae' 0708]|uniref:MerR family transcriptional regulator n=1 Tax=Nostoc azollae (strain 0708) TaxID=551115 RepID=D7E0W2_NOSA0|nr:MerR family transcriptional regulator ['Nostoc azollae' 0708]